MIEMVKQELKSNQHQSPVTCKPSNFDNNCSNYSEFVQCHVAANTRPDNFHAALSTNLNM